MKRIYIIMIMFCLFLIGCSSQSNNASQVSSKQSELDEPVIVFDDTYKLMYNNVQKENSRDREEIVKAKSIMEDNFEKTKKNILLDQQLNVVPLSYSISENQNGKFLMFNIFVINTSGKTITDFQTIVNYSFLNSTFTDGHTLEIENLGVSEIKDKEGVVIGYGSDIADEPSDYFSNLNLADVTIKLTDLTVTTE